MKRRKFLAGLIANATLSNALIAGTAFAFTPQSGQRYLRPPGAAIEEETFLKKCIRCGQCGEVCPNRCIKYFGLENGTASLDTPYIIPREQACILCMKCGDVCPTGALEKIDYEASAIILKVKMGKAQVNRSLCLSWQGKTCGVCYRACPLADVAIKVGLLEQPEVLDNCVGCGLCERSCIQLPQAIKVVPYYQLST